MSTIQASAHPHKSFFVEMFTRDITLHECILDLIDNSIDGLIRTTGKKLDLKNLLETLQSSSTSNVPTVSVVISGDSITISDNCGGISLIEAEREVFNFGHSSDYHRQNRGAGLGVYGIGLKRALFKIGAIFEMTSRTKEDGFRLRVDLAEWVKEDSLEKWTFPLTPIGRAKFGKETGTTIKITHLRKDAKDAISDEGFLTRLEKEVGRNYALLLKKFVNIVINGSRIEPIYLPIAESKEVTPAFLEFEDDGVTVQIYASLARRDIKGEWPGAQAGWYVACNGRLVVVADKTDLTGWGEGRLPEFHTGKFRGFVGLVLFLSDNPLKLPWTTKKSGLNRESLIYQKACREMDALARPILTFLNKMYSQEVQEAPEQRKIADGVRPVGIGTLAKGGERGFSVNPAKKRKEKTSVRIQYDAEKSDIEKIKKHLRRPDLSCSAIGELTFNEYLRAQGLK